MCKKTTKFPCRTLEVFLFFLPSILSFSFSSSISLKNYFGEWKNKDGVMKELWRRSLFIKREDRWISTK